MKPQQFDLIKSVFNSAEAKEVLLCLIDSKIQFHNDRIFSDKVRLGTDNVESMNRVKELNETRKNIVSLITECEKNGTQLSIHSQIVIESLAKKEAA